MRRSIDLKAIHHNPLRLCGRELAREGVVHPLDFPRQPPFASKRPPTDSPQRNKNPHLKNALNAFFL
jgi:hypothetical protein